MMNFWDRPAVEVAADLISRVLIYGEHRTVVRAADSFTSDQNATGAYAAMLGMTPGSIYCVKVMSHVMLLIVTADGSCVRVKSAQVDGAQCTKPGVVTRALSLTTHKQRGRVTASIGQGFLLELETP